MSTYCIPGISKARTKLTLAVGLLFFTAVSTLAQSTSIESIGGVFGETMFYNAMTQEWAMTDAVYTSGTVNRRGGGLTWTIAPQGTPSAQLDWSGSYLDQDMSTGPVTTPINPALWTAEATFLDGGEVSITGKVWEVDENDQPVSELYDGLLLAGDVSAFHVIEFMSSTSILNLPGNPPVVEATVHPTGGWLLTSAGMHLAGDYNLAIVISQTKQNGVSGVYDFSNGTLVGTGSLFSLVQVPEPATALLLIAGSLLFVTRRKR